jgi:hypothetical protein
MDGQLEVLGMNRSSQLMWSFEPDGSPTASWNFVPWTGTPGQSGMGEVIHFGDITGDGFPELVYHSHFWELAAYSRDATGTMLPGFPSVVGQFVGRMALEDLDGDGALEIIGTAGCDCYQNEVFVIDGSGMPVPGWPQTITGYPFGLAVGDLEFDGELEIVVTTADPFDPDAGPSPIYVFDTAGNLRDGWPVLLQQGQGVLVHVVLADIDGDYQCEIIGSGIDDTVYILNSDGELIAPIWQVPTGGGKSPVVGDLDGDGDLEIITIGAGIAVSDLDGVIVQIPAYSPHFAWDGVVIGDVDGDGICEIGARSGSGQPLMHLWNSNLQPLPGWPKPVGPIGSSGYRIVDLADLDLDDDLEIVQASRTHIDCWDIPNPSGSPLRVEWGTYFGNPQRTQNYHTLHPPGPRFLRGDADGDGEVRFGDAFASLAFLLGEVEHPCPERIDWDANGTADLADVVAQLTYNFLGGAPPEAPFPDCGMLPPGEAQLPCAFEPCP